MTSRTRLVAQGVAIGLVVLLFILLAWSLATNKGGDLSKKANRGTGRRRPTSRSSAWIAAGRSRSPRYAARPSC